MVTEGVLAILRKPNGNIRSLLLHFAAGDVFSVVAVELLPDIVREHKPTQVVIGFALGLIAMRLIKRFAESKETDEEVVATNKLPVSLLVATGVDIFIDGFVIGYRFFRR